MIILIIFDILTVAVVNFFPTPHVGEKSRVSGIWRILHLLALVRAIAAILTTRVVVRICPFGRGFSAILAIFCEIKDFAPIWPKGQIGLLGHFPGDPPAAGRPWFAGPYTGPAGPPWSRPWAPAGALEAQPELKLWLRWPSARRPKSGQIWANLPS